MNPHLSNHELEVYHCPNCQSLFIDLSPLSTDVVFCNYCYTVYLNPLEVLPQ